MEYSPKKFLKNSAMITVICLIFLIISIFFDFYTIKIPNSNVLILGSFLMAVNYFFYGINIWPQSIGCVALTILTLFPLFALGVMGAGDIKLLAVLAIPYGYKGAMIIFCFALVWGLLIGIVKIIKYGGLGERLKYLFNYLNQLVASLRVRGGEAFEQSYIKGLDEEMVKKSGIHFSLPIFLGYLIYIGGVKG